MEKQATSLIEGYSEMSTEEKLSALEALKINDLSEDVERYKNAASKANSEAAEWKKKHNALLSEEEKKKQEKDEELTSLRKEVEEMQKDKLIAGHTASFLALGYDEALAKETAIAMANGETEKVFANQRKFLESHDKSYKAKLMGEMKEPPAGSSGDGAGTDYTKLIDEARKNGDYAAVAYYMRLAEEEKNKE